MSERYKVGDSGNPHFCTLTVVGWIDLFTRRQYKDILVDSLDYCIQHKGLVLHAYCLMPSHIHLISSTRLPNTTLAAVIRDFKKYTSVRLRKEIQAIDESRREWLLALFAQFNNRVKRGRYYKIWQDGFHPVELDTNQMIDQRLDYLHRNPVEDGTVILPEDYQYSSARQYFGEEGLLPIEPIV